MSLLPRNSSFIAKLGRPPFASLPLGALGAMHAMKLLDITIIIASGLWGMYRNYGSPDLVFGIIGGLIAGVIFAWMVRGVTWLARTFREKAPRAASYTGTTAFWLGIAIAVFCAGVSVYSIYDGAPAWLVGSLAGLGAGLWVWLGWGIRYALSGDRSSI